MKPEIKSAIKTAGTFGLIGAGVLAAFGTPAAWAALAIATAKIGKAAYQDAKGRPTVKQSDDSWFV